MSEFSEDSRVKFPTIKHLMEMGFTYISQKGLKTKDIDKPKTNIDSQTNILIDYFNNAYLKLNPSKELKDAENCLKEIQKVLTNEDLGRKFYYEFLLNTAEKIIDLSNPDNFRLNNTFQVATELTCGNKDGDNFRPDITLFINGIPLAFIEVKKENNSKGIQAETERMKVRFKNAAFRRYLNITQIMVFSNDMEYDDENITPTQGAFYAAIGKRTTKYSTFREEGQDSFPIQKRLFKVTPEDEEFLLRDNNVPQYRTYSEYITNCKINTPTKRICDSLFSFERFHFFLKYGITYADYPNGLQKHIMRYPQVFATKAIERYIDAGNKHGIIWHTQGSGKTALAYYNVKHLTDYFSKQGIIPQFFFIVDRLELLDQAQREFSYRGLKVTPVQSKDDFTKIITDPHTTLNKEGKPEITVVNIQKFSSDSRAISKQAYNVKVKRVYFIDEAHRDYDPEGSFLKNLLASDTEAIIIALTGTPIIGKGFNTKKIFGGYIHAYYYNASISDGYTLRLIREDIHSNFKIQMQDTLKNLRVNNKFVRKEDVYAHKNYVEPLLEYIVNDLREFRVKNADPSLGAMVACNSKIQAKVMYDLFLRSYAQEDEVNYELLDDGQYEASSVPPEEIDAKHTPLKSGRYRAALIVDDYLDKETRAKWVNLFKEGKIDFLFVFMMLQTGFDAPRLKKLYLHRMAREHNLLQTLTRVNRPYKNLKYGYVVDFANIEEEYKKTNDAYQEELENEVGKDNVETINRLFVSEAEAKKQIEAAVKTLEPYDLHNPTKFSNELNLEKDSKRVNEILKALETLQAIENMLSSQGSKVEDLFEYKDIHSLIKATRNRLNLMNFENHSEERENVKQLLNLALEDIMFSFDKAGEHELELYEQYKEAVEHTRKQLAANYDNNDPEFITIFDAFMKIVSKNGMTEENANSVNMHEQVEYVNSILKRIREMNQRNDLRAIKYNGDKKFVRIENRLREKAEQEENTSPEIKKFTWTKSQEKMSEILLHVKEDVDDSFFRNEAIIESPGYFGKVIKTFVTRQFRDAEIKTDSDVRTYVSDLINKEYQVTAR